MTRYPDRLRGRRELNFLLGGGLLFTWPLMRHVHEQPARFALAGNALVAGRRELAVTSGRVRQHPAVL